MINDKQLQQIINKYQLSLTRERKRQLINNGDPAEIDAILNYLINELNIDKKNIEKCPSILYQTLNIVKTNYDFLGILSEPTILITITIPEDKVLDIDLKK